MGRVIAPWGVRGWVKVAPLSSDPDALLDHPTWWLKAPGEADWRESAVGEAKMHGVTLVALLEGVATREDAALRRGSEIAVPRAALPPLAEDEMYVGDLVGLEVVNRQGVALGSVKSVQDYGAHPVLRVVSGNVERLIPYVAAHVDGVDRATRTMTVDWQPDY